MGLHVHQTPFQARPAYPDRNDKPGIPLPARNAGGQGRETISFRNISMPSMHFELGFGRSPQGLEAVGQMGESRAVPSMKSHPARTARGQAVAGAAAAPVAV